MSMPRSTSGGPARGVAEEPTRTARHPSAPVEPESLDVPESDDVPIEGPTNPGVSAPWRGHLEIRFAGGSPSRRLLIEPHLVLGRVPGVQVFLDHHTVSRRHAEMFCDPFGRWWIRDLGSTNGTLVNGEQVTEQALQPGDRIGIGDYGIGFHLGEAEAGRAVGRLPPVEFEKPTEIHTLLDFEPPRIAAEQLRTLLELSRRFISLESPGERLAALCQTAVRDDFKGIVAVVLRLEEDGHPTRLSRTWRAGGRSDDDAPYVSRRVLRHVRDTGEPVLAGAADGSRADTPALELTMTGALGDLCVIACPLQVTEGSVDVLYVTLPPAVGGAEWLSLFALAAEVYRQSEESWAARLHARAHDAIERELQTARQIQRGLLPKRLDFPGLDVAVGFEPCKWVGGDYVDAVELADGRVLLVVADVCGKGLQAALVTSSLHTMVRAASDAAPSLADLMERINRHLCDWLPSHSFVTMVAAAVDPVTGEIECVNAGHPPVLIADRDGDVRFLQMAENPALGVAPFEVEPQRALLEFGDVLVMYTDGLTELRDAASREMLGQDRLGEGFARICAENPGERSAVISDALCRMLDRYQGAEAREDDRAFVLAQRWR